MDNILKKFLFAFSVQKQRHFLLWKIN